MNGIKLGILVERFLINNFEMADNIPFNIYVV